MSLIHWWPLNGDIQDKIQGKIFNNTGMTSNSSGKIGSCYGTSNGHMLSVTVEIPSTFSFSCWVKNNDFTYPKTNVPVRFSNGSPYNTPNTTNKGWEFSHGTAGTSYKFTMNDSATKNEISWNNAQYIGNALLGKWYHVALTVEHSKKEVTLYINGNNLGTKTYTPNDFGGTFSLVIGQLSGWKLDGYLNDIRIYDHALSQAEVKELSKALVMHYTFDDVLAEPTTNVSTISGWSSYTSYFVISERTKTGLKVYRPSSSTSNVLALNNSAVTGNMTAGDIWTFSCFLYVDGKPYKCTQSDMSTYNYSGISYYSNDDGYYTCTFRVGSPETWIIHASMFGDVGTNVICEIDKIQFEKKDHVTPYTLTSRSSMLRNETGLTQPSMSDNVSLTTDSSSGTLALKCQGNTQIVCTNTGDTSQGVTVSCRVKCSIPSDSRLIFADNNSKIAFGFFNNGQAIITCAGYGHACISNVRTNWMTGWNHIIVRKASNNVVDCYINGIKQNLSGSQEWTHSSTNSLSIGCRYSGGWTSHFTGLIDDFRFYNTCLSANDIAELYKTKAYITNKGDIEAHEFVEKTENIITEDRFAIPAKSTAGNGKIEMRNGVMAYGLQASTYYYANDSESSNAIFKGKFKSNTQYYFDLFMDVDTMWYSGGSKYVPGGFVLRYTDGTTVEIIATSTDGANGWKRVQFYSNPDKTIYGLGVYYYIGTKWYLRHDSGIYEMDKDNAQVTSKYTVETTQVTETSYQTNALIHSSGNIVGREIIEI